ncbi:hypothetical protein ACS0TY_018519 [Phlomoides rotata]
MEHLFNGEGYMVSKHINSVLNTLLKLHTVLLVTSQPVPENYIDNRWKYFKICRVIEIEKELFQLMC